MPSAVLPMAVRAAIMVSFFRPSPPVFSIEVSKAGWYAGRCLCTANLLELPDDAREKLARLLHARRLDAVANFECLSRGVIKKIGDFLDWLLESLIHQLRAFGLVFAYPPICVDDLPA